MPYTLNPKSHALYPKLRHRNLQPYLSITPPCRTPWIPNPTHYTEYPATFPRPTPRHSSLIRRSSTAMFAFPSEIDMLCLAHDEVGLARASPRTVWGWSWVKGLG